MQFKWFNNEIEPLTSKSNQIGQQTSTLFRLLRLRLIPLCISAYLHYCRLHHTRSFRVLKILVEFQSFCVSNFRIPKILVNWEYQRSVNRGVINTGSLLCPYNAYNVTVLPSGCSRAPAVLPLMHAYETPFEDSLSVVQRLTSPHAFLA